MLPAIFFSQAPDLIEVTLHAQPRDFVLVQFETMYVSTPKSAEIIYPIIIQDSIPYT